MVPVTALELLFKLCWIAAKYSLCFHVYERKLGSFMNISGPRNPSCGHKRQLVKSLSNGNNVLKQKQGNQRCSLTFSLQLYTTMLLKRH